MNTVVITGASSGIGRELAAMLGAEDAEVHLLGRSVERLEEVAKAVPNARSHPVDLREDGDVRRVAAALTGALARIDVLIHSAGVVTLGPVETAPVEELDWNLAVNLRAPVLLTQLLLPRIVSAKGQIVFVNSGAGLSARAGWSYYAASKFGLRAIADALRDEVRPQGVRVMTVYPGRTATPMQERVRRLEGAEYDPNDFIQPKDVSRMVVAGLSLPRSADVVELNIRPGGKT